MGATRRSIVVGALVAGLVLRVWPRGPLWLDEAQTVSIARQPLRRITAALREDGAPPLQYVLLHGWMRVFGDGDVAVRSLTVLTSIAMVAAVAWVASRWAGPDAGAAAAVLVAVHPFAARYATEARMYSLVMLEVTLGVALVHAHLERPRARWLVGLSLVTVALLLTHYWAMFLIAVSFVLVVVAAWRSAGARRRSLVGVGAAMAVGGLLWLPWVPVFLFQSRRTATPWTEPPGIRELLLATNRPSDAGVWVSLLVAVMIVLGVVAVVRHRPTGVLPAPAWLLATGVGALVLALLGGIVSGSAYVGRYTSIAFPLFVLAAAAGVASLSRRSQTGVLAMLVVWGLLTSASEVRTPRTTAPDVVAALAARVQPGDQVIYCPDQLGPATSRLLDRAVTEPLLQRSYPPGSDVDRVDWIDYRTRYADADPAEFAAEVDADTPNGVVWLVWSGTYPATERACTSLVQRLSRIRPHWQVLPDRPAVADHGGLWRFGPRADVDHVGRPSS